MDTDLSVRDIKFLRAIRDINANPGSYEKTDRGAVPANKTSITLATDLGKKEVSYRLGGNHSRGFEDGEEPLIISHDPEIIEDANRFGPRSAELTEHGIQLLSEFEASGYMGGGEREDEPETIKQLRARLDTLESDGVGGGRDDDELGGRVDRLEAELESLKQSRWGAVDERYHSDLDKTVDRLPPMFYLLSEVFGFDVDRVAEEAPYDEETLVEVREAVVDTLGLSVSESGSGSGSVADSGPESMSMDDFEGEPDSSVSSDGGVESESENESGGEGGDDPVPPHPENFDDGE